jgi:hypothetical protein
VSGVPQRTFRAAVLDRTTSPSNSIISSSFTRTSHWFNSIDTVPEVTTHLFRREQHSCSASGILQITGQGHGGRDPLSRRRTTMNTNANYAHADVLSDNELDAVSGGGDSDRHEVTKEQFDTLNTIRQIAAKDGGTSQAVDLAAWKAAMKTAK